MGNKKTIIKLLTLLIIFICIGLTSFLTLNTIPFRITSLLPSGHPLIAQYDYFAENFDDENIIYFSYKLDENLKVKTKYLENKLHQLSFIKKITTIDNFETLSFSNDQFRWKPIHYDLDKLDNAHQLLKNIILSKDKKYVALIVTLTKNISKKDEMLLLKNIFDIEKDFKNQFKSDLWIIGTKVAAYHFLNDLIKNQVFTTPLILLIIGLIVFLMFKRISIVLYFMGILLLNYSATVLFIILMEGGFSPFSGLALMFSLIITTSDLIHYYAALERGTGVLKIFKPCLFTTLTTGIGFFAFIYNEMAPIRNFGLYCSFASLMGFLLTFYVMPVLLKIFEYESNKSHTLIFKSEKIYLGVQRFKYPIVFASLILFIMALLVTRNLKFSDNFYHKFVSSHHLTKSLNSFTKSFGSVGSVDLLIGYKEDTMRPFSENYIKFENDLLDEVKIVKIESPRQFERLIKSTMNDESNQESFTDSFFRFSLLRGILSGFHNDKNKHFRVKLHLNSTSTSNINQILDKVDILKQKYNLDVSYAGFISIRAFLFKNVLIDFAQSFTFTLILIFLIFLVIFRSIKWAIIGMIPNLVPILAVPALMIFFKIEIDNNLIVLLCIIIGVAVDDTIHFLMALKENLLSHNLMESLKLSFDSTSKALIGTTLIFTLCFPCFLISDLNLIFQMGFFIVFALILALVTDLLLLPAIIMLFWSKKRRE